MQTFFLVPGFFPYRSYQEGQAKKSGHFEGCIQFHCLGRISNLINKYSSFLGVKSHYGSWSQECQKRIQNNRN